MMYCQRYLIGSKTKEEQRSELTQNSVINTKVGVVFTWEYERAGMGLGGDTQGQSMGTFY